MRILWTCFCLGTGLLGLGLLAWGQQASSSGNPPSGYGGYVFYGARAIDNSGYLGRVAEFDPAPQGLNPALGASIWLQKGFTFLDAFVDNRGDSRDQTYRLDLQLHRYLRLAAFYSKFLHRLDHDPLDYLDAAKGGPVVRHTDLAPGVEYAPAYSEGKTELHGVIPGWTALRFRAGLRTQYRHGGVQARTMSKCATCHIVGTTKNIGQRLYDVTAGLSLRLSHVSLDYDYLNRQFAEHEQAPLIQYDAAVHPVSGLPIFGNRVIYDQQQGLLPFSLVPDLRKSLHSLKLRFDLPREARLSAAATQSRVRNKYTGLGVDSWGWSSRFAIPLGERVQFTAQVRQLDYDADDVFVDLNEPVAIAGPQAGKTYSQAYPDFGAVDFWRYSLRSRNLIAARGELAFRLARLANLRGGYEFRRLKRDHYEVEKTEYNRLYATFSTRQKTASGDWVARLSYRLELTRDPFVHLKAALPPALQPYPSPGTPPSPLAGLQYFVLYASRQANLTRFPTRSQFVEPVFTWSPNPRFSVNLHYRYRGEKNDDLNFSDWERQVHAPGIELWFAPWEKLDLTVAYDFQNERTATLFGIAVYDG